jgi:hypothetical protein
MKKLLYIAPHLSTGGLPQYLTKKIELLNDTYDIYVVEYDDITGGVLVIQKNKIKNLIGDKLITIPFGSDKNVLIDKINEIQPDIIHLEELPEYFMSDDIAKKIYTDNRNYKIFETCHDSSFNTNNKRFSPDKFILVSNYQVKMLDDLKINSEVVEYPIEYKNRPDRDQSLINLGLDPTYKHVLHIGLFTPRKNQKEFFEYAEKFVGQKIQFHSIGCMADNFKHYWEPLLKDKPENIIIHGEKSNVDDFYSSMDLFLFTSKGTVNDKETMPLVIREAISWNIPTLIYNLPVYENYFDKFNNISYLDFNDFDKNVDEINKLSKLEQEKNVVIISSYTANDTINKITLNCIKSIKNLGYDIILTSHAPIPVDLQNEVDYVVYDKNNLLTYHDYYAFYNYDDNEITVNMDIRTEKNHIYHGPAVYTNYYNGLALAQRIGYDNAICVNYDMIIKDDVFNTLLNKLKTKKAVFNITKAQEGYALRTVIFATNINFFMDKFKKVIKENDYTNWKNYVGSESNGLENMFYHTLKNNLNEMLLLDDDEFYELLSNCEIDLCSYVEYFNVLPISGGDNQFAIWFSTNNLVDERNFKILCFKNDLLFDTFNINTSVDKKFYKIFDYNNEVYDFVLFDDYDKIKSIKVDQEYINNNIKNNGKLIIK